MGCWHGPCAVSGYGRDLWDLDCAAPPHPCDALGVGAGPVSTATRTVQERPQQEGALRSPEMKPSDLQKHEGVRLMKTTRWSKLRTMRKHGCGAVVLALGLLLGASVGIAQTSPFGQAIEEARIRLSCQDPGSSQEAGKMPVITNTSDKPLTKDQHIVWSASDGDRGQITLENDLPTGGQVQGRGSPGSGYSCEAYTLG